MDLSSGSNSFHSVAPLYHAALCDLAFSKLGIIRTGPSYLRVFISLLSLNLLSLDLIYMYVYTYVYICIHVYNIYIY